MIMLASEIENDCFLLSHMDELSSNELLPENIDDWLPYIVSSLKKMHVNIPWNLSQQPIFTGIPQTPAHASLPDELEVCSSQRRDGESSVQIVARAVTSSKIGFSAPKLTRPPTSTFSVAAVSVPATVEVYKPKIIAELIDMDPEELDVKKGPQKKRRCR